MSAQLRYRGMFFKKSVLLKKEKCKTALEKFRQEQRNLTFNDKREVTIPCDGNRIVNLQVLAKNLRCTKCRCVLSLENIVDERKRGLMSTLIVQCEACQMKLKVDTETSHDVNKDSKAFLTDKTHNDVTTNAVLGAFHAGIGNTELNQILSCLDLPTINPKLYQKHEKEIGPVIEAAARRSCRKAAIEERKLVQEKILEICKEL